MPLERNTTDFSFNFVHFDISISQNFVPLHKEKLFAVILWMLITKFLSVSTAQVIHQQFWFYSYNTQAPFAKQTIISCELFVDTFPPLPFSPGWDLCYTVLMMSHKTIWHLPLSEPVSIHHRQTEHNHSVLYQPALVFLNKTHMLTLAGKAFGA